LASLIDIQEEATVSRTVLREDGLRAVLFGFDKDQALSEHTAAMPSNPARCCCRCSTTAADSVNDWQSRMRS